MVRVSGTEGLRYAGNYGTLEGEPQAVDDVVRHEPTDYDVLDGDVGGAFARLSKIESGEEGQLTVQIVVAGEEVAGSITYTESGRGEGSVRWSPQGVEET
jgi:hypothetical protein